MLLKCDETCRRCDDLPIGYQQHTIDHHVDGNSIQNCASRTKCDAVNDAVQPDDLRRSDAELEHRKRKRYVRPWCHHNRLTHFSCSLPALVCSQVCIAEQRRTGGGVPCPVAPHTHTYRIDRTVATGATLGPLGRVMEPKLRPPAAGRRDCRDASGAWHNLAFTCQLALIGIDDAHHAAPAASSLRIAPRQQCHTSHRFKVQNSPSQLRARLWLQLASATVIVGSLLDRPKSRKVKAL